MKTYRKTSIFIISLLTVTSMIWPGQVYSQNEDKAVILTSNTILKDIVENMVGNLVEVESLYPVGGRSWDQNGKAWPDDISVSLVIYEEGERLDVPKVIPSIVLPSKSPKTALEVLSPAFVLLQVQTLSRTLIETYPDYFEEITFNTDLFISDLRTVDSLIRQGFDTLDSALPLITEGQSLLPFCRHYGLPCLSLDDERPGKAALLVESTSSPRSIQAVADETSWPIVGQVYTRSLSKADGPAATYLDLLLSNASVLRRSLQSKMTSPPPTDLPTWMDWRMILFIGVLALITGVMALRVVRKL